MVEIFKNTLKDANILVMSTKREFDNDTFWILQQLKRSSRGTGVELEKGKLLGLSGSEAPPLDAQFKILYELKSLGVISIELLPMSHSDFLTGKIYDHGEPTDKFLYITILPKFDQIYGDFRKVADSLRSEEPNIIKIYLSQGAFEIRFGEKRYKPTETYKRFLNEMFQFFKSNDYKISGKQFRLEIDATNRKSSLNKYKAKLRNINRQLSDKEIPIQIDLNSDCILPKISDSIKIEYF